MVATVQHMAAPHQKQLQEYHYARVTLEEKNRCSYYSNGRMKNDNLRSQVKNRTFQTCKLFLLTLIFKHINNWSKVFEVLLTLILHNT